MSQYVKSYVRVRGNLPTELGGSCVTLKGANQIECKKPLEPLRTLDKVFNDMTDNGELFDTIAAPAVEKLTSGKLALICVGGELTSGKTHFTRGRNNGEELSDSLVGRIIQSIAGNEEANMCILYFHNDICQDLSTNADNLKLKLEETGTTAEGSTTVRIPNAQAGYDHVQKCIAKRDSFFGSMPFNEDLTFLVFIFGVGLGRLTVIEFPGYGRVGPAPLSLSPDMNKETQNKNKAIGQVMKLWIDSATCADAKAIAWKDTKIGRFLQPGLSSALDQVGYAALVTCVINNVTNLHETAAALMFAEQCVKQDGLKTVSEYKEQIAFLEERLDANGKEKPALAATAAAEEATAKKVKAENEARIEELDDKYKMLDQKLSSTQLQYKNDLDKMRKDIEKKKADLEKKNTEDIDRMRNLAKNAPAQAAADIRKKVQEVEDENKVQITQIQGDMGKMKSELQDAREKLKSSKASDEKNKAEEAEAMKPVKELEKELFKLKANMTFAMRNREEGLSPEEVAQKQPLWDVRDMVDDLDEDIQKIIPEAMRLEAIVTAKAGRPSGASDSDEDSGSESGSDASSKSSESDKGPQETEEEKAARLQAEKEAEEKRKEEERLAKLERLSVNRERDHFRETIRKDFFLSELLEKILMYLEFGCNTTMVTPKGLERQYLSIGNKRRSILVHNEVKQMALGEKKTLVTNLPIDKVTGLHLGQHSPLFGVHLKKIAGRVDPSRFEIPPHVSEISIANMHRFYYRSFTIQTANDASNIDIICDTETDFEAMIVALHRVSGRNGSWGKPLFIDLLDRVDDLLPQEKLLCEQIHLHPHEYLNRRKLILESDDKLYVTLHDLRVLCALDLYHSQKLLEMWLRNRWIIRRQLNYWKYQEVKDLEAARKSAADAAAEVERAKLEEDEEAPPAPEDDDEEEDEDD